MLEQHSYTDINAETWDQWARDGIACSSGPRRASGT